MDAYLTDGTEPEGVTFLAIPTGKVVRRRGFWLTPEHKFHAAANCFLISTDVYAMNTDEFEHERDQAYCYVADEVNTVYIGVIETHALNELLILNPLLEGQFPPLDATKLRYIGRVIAAI